MKNSSIQTDLDRLRRKKEFIATTLGHGDHLLPIFPALAHAPTKVSVVDFGYDDEGQHECEITIHEEGVELEDVIHHIEVQQGIYGSHDLPAHTPEQFEALKASIEQHGVVEPVVVDERGNVIEGRTRKRIAKELGINCPTITVKGLTARQKQQLALELDMCRKHYGRKQRAEIVVRLLKRLPRESNHTIARMTGTTAKTVRKYRSELESGGKIPQVIERQGKDGKTYRLPRIVASSDKELDSALTSIKNLPTSNGSKILDPITAKRRAKKHRRLQKRQIPVVHVSSADIQLFHTPFQELEKLAGIEPASAQLVFTDIPYGPDFLPQVEELAEFAERILVPGGVFATYVGSMYLPQLFSTFGKHLNYRWQIISGWTGERSQLRLSKFGTVFSHQKPILIYSKGDSGRNYSLHDLFVNEQKEKTWHEWQQPISEAESLIEFFSKPGELVVDPCAGGFTIAAACVRANRRSISCDVDEQAVARGQRRINEELERRSAL